MKSNHVVLLATFIINVFVALSLNSFSTSEMYMPALFLYFAPNLIAFIEKILFYRENKYRFELVFSWLSALVCIIDLSALISDSLEFIELVFPCDCGKYRILMQGIPNSFITFNSIDVTWFLFMSIIVILLTYFIYFLIDMLRSHGYNFELIIQITRAHATKLTMITTLFFIVGGILGAYYCWHNSKISKSEYGEPQYWKYIIVFGGLLAVSSYIILLNHYKKVDNSNTHTE